MQVGGNANAVRILNFLIIKKEYSSMIRMHFFNNMVVKQKIFKKNIIVVLPNFIEKNFINLLRKQ